MSKIDSGHDILPSANNSLCLSLLLYYWYWICWCNQSYIQQGLIIVVNYEGSTYPTARCPGQTKLTIRQVDIGKVFFLIMYDFYWKMLNFRIRASQNVGTWLTVTKTETLRIEWELQRWNIIALWIHEIHPISGPRWWVIGCLLWVWLCHTLYCNAQDIYHGYQFENYWFKTSTTSSRGQWVK